MIKTRTEKEYQDLQNEISSLKSQLAECKEHYDYQAHLVNSLYKQISDLIDENKALEKQLAKFEVENTDLIAELEQDDALILELQYHFEKDQKQISSLKSQLANIKYLNTDEVEK